MLQHFQKCYNIFKNVTIVESGYYIWNHHKICVEISTDMPIGLVNLEIGFEFTGF